MECESPQETRAWAIITCGHMEKDAPSSFWGSRPWSVTLTGADGLILWELSIGGFEISRRSRFAKVGACMDLELRLGCSFAYGGPLTAIFVLQGSIRSFIPGDRRLERGGCPTSVRLAPDRHERWLYLSRRHPRRSDIGALPPSFARPSQFQS
jgi:hypothetical protein